MSPTEDIQILDPCVATTDSTPTIRWTAVGEPGETTTYDLWIQNRTTGEVFRQRDIVDVNHANVVAADFTPGPGKDIEELAPGSYRAYVKAIDQTGWSKPFDFRIEPALTSLRAETESGSNRAINEPIELSWDAVDGVSHYEVFVRKAGENEAFLVDRFQQANSLVLNHLPLGNYKWWVKAVMADGFKSDWSARSTFDSGEDPQPVITHGGVTNSNARRMIVQWTGENSTADSWDLYITKDGAENLFRRVNGLTSTTYISEALGDGIYGYWVRASVGGEKTDWSNLVRVEVDGPTPEIVTPIGTTTDSTPEIRWIPISGSPPNYRIWITGPTPVVATVSGGTTSYTPDTPLDPGFYRLYVRASAPDGAWSRWSVVNFTVELPSA